MHQRQAIRQAVKALILGDGTQPWADRVWVNRPNPLSQRSHQDSALNQLPAVLIYTRTGSDEKFNEAPREYLRTVELVIEIAAAMNDKIDDTLDEYADTIERLILNDPYLGETAADTLLTGSGMTIVDDGEIPIGAVILTFDVTYRQHFPDETVAAALDDLETVHNDYDLDGDQADADQTSDTIQLNQSGLLKETGDDLLLENGGRMLMEA